MDTKCILQYGRFQDNYPTNESYLPENLYDSLTMLDFKILHPKYRFSYRSPKSDVSQIIKPDDILTCWIDIAGLFSG